MTAARDLVHDDLVTYLPEGYQVESWAPQLDNVTEPTILLRVDTITPEPTAGQHARRYQGAVLAVSPLQDATAEDVAEVDNLAEDVLHAIDQSNVLSWTEAKRVSVDDAWAGWEVTFRTSPLAPTP